MRDSSVSCARSLYNTFSSVKKKYHDLIESFTFESVDERRMYGARQPRRPRTDGGRRRRLSIVGE